MHDKNELHTKRDWSEWLLTNRRMIALSCVAILVLLVGGIWLLQSSASRKFKDFETADTLADELQQGQKFIDGASPDQALAQLRVLNDKYSILQPRFDSLIAEEMLLAGNSKELDPYAKRAISRLNALDLTDFAAFSEVSRLTGLEDYKAALQKATELKAALANKPAERQYLLQAFLLLHIATLNQKLGLHDAMLQSIIELKEFLGLMKRETPLTAEQKAQASEMLAHLQDRQHSLLEYIEEVPQSTGT